MTGAMRRAAPQDEEDDDPKPPSAPSDAASLAPTGADAATLPAEDALVAALQADAAEFDAWLAAGKSAYKSIFSRESSGPPEHFDHSSGPSPRQHVPTKASSSDNLFR